MATVRRDIALMRDRLRAPISYDPERNAYVYDGNEDDPWEYRTRFDLPGMWLDQHEAYALLTLLNVTSQIDPGLFMPHTASFRGVLKKMLAYRNVPMKGFHKKVVVDLPNLDKGNRHVIHDLGTALTEDRQVVARWKNDEGKVESETVSLQRFVLGAAGWIVDLVVDRDRSRRQVPLTRFTKCVVTTEPAELLPEFRSDPAADFEALQELYLRQQGTLGFRFEPGFDVLETDEKGLSADVRDGTPDGGSDCVEQVGHQCAQVSQPVGLRAQDDHGHRDFRNPILKRQVAVDRDEHVELRSSQTQQFAVPDFRPAHLAGCADVVTYEVSQQAPVDALVEKHLHAGSFTNSSAAASRNATTSPRFTMGKPSRKSSIESPASRCSTSVRTGTRVPANTGVPPITAGSLETKENFIFQ